MKKQALISHFLEFKSRLLKVIIAFFIFFILAYIFARPIFNLLLLPLANMVGSTHKIIYTNLAEMFVTEIQQSLAVGFALTIPFALIQLYLFVSPGLYKAEKKILIPFMLFIPVLFILGMLFSYFVILPIAWEFFLSFESVGKSSLPIILEAKASEYFSLASTIIISGGIIFQLPIFMFISMKCNLVSVEFYKKKRRMAFVIIFIISAFLTPPDVFSQIGLAIPMIMLYELSIIIWDLTKGSKC